MLRKQKKKRNEYSAKIIWQGTPLGELKNIWLEDLEEGIDAIPNELHKVEALFVWNCIKTGKKVEVRQKEILLYEKKMDFDQKADYIVEENPELYSLLEKLVQTYEENQKRIHS